MKSRTKLLITICTAIVLVAGIVYYKQQKQDVNCERGMSGECLPAGKCVAPNDAIVSCEALKQNPTKTNW